LILTYAFGFNLLCSYNLQSTFETYSFYNPSVTPWIIGVILALLVGFCLFGGGKRIVKLTSVLVPFMGLFYVFLVYIILVVNYDMIPSVIVAIMRDAFDFEAIGGGIAGSCLMYGIKRGLYSNEAGVGSAPNAAAAAHVSHPVKQGLAQVISVYIDTLFLCTATAMMCLVSGVPGTAENAGAMYVQQAVSKTFDAAGPVFITVAMALFAFTTLLGNLFYVHNAIAFINNKKMPSKKVMTVIHIACCLVVLFGAVTPMDACWALADITMGGMALINLPACVILGNVAFMALRDYERQRRRGRNPAFIARYIKLDPLGLDYWRHKERDSKV
jgi:AGCS family alanine or glycine:cation symporter